MKQRGTLIALGGLSGTGKSTQCRYLTNKFNAVWLRTDSIRKELWGVPETQKLPHEAYSREHGAQLHAEFNRRLNTALQQGKIVVADAVFATEAGRAGVERIAKANNAAFFGFWLEAHPDTMRARVAARKNDASDADIAVVNQQLAYNLGTIDWHRIDANGTPAQTQAQLDKILTPPRVPTPRNSIPKP